MFSPLPCLGGRCRRSRCRLRRIWLRVRGRRDSSGPDRHRACAWRERVAPPLRNVVAAHLQARAASVAAGAASAAGAARVARTAFVAKQRPPPPSLSAPTGPRRCPRSIPRPAPGHVPSPVPARASGPAPGPVRARVPRLRTRPVPCSRDPSTDDDDDEEEGG